MKLRGAFPLLFLLNGCSCGTAGMIDGGAPADAASDHNAAPDSANESGTADAGVDAEAPCSSASASGARTGCDYVAFSPSRMGVFPFACLALVVMNPGAEDVTLSLTWQGAPVDVSQHGALTKGFGRSMTYEPLTQATLPSHRTAVISLAQGALNQLATACPSPAVVVDSSNHIDALANGTARTFRLRTSGVTAAYRIWPLTKNSVDYTTVSPLPAVPSWRSAYLDVGAYLPAPYPYDYLAWTAVVASLDGTNVSIPSAEAGVLANTLASDQLLNVARADAFIGQSVAASRPFALWAGSAGFQVPGDSDPSTSCLAASAVPPVEAWGREYAFAAPSNRIETINERHFFRVVSAANGTILTYSPASPAGAPSNLEMGGSATFFADASFVVRSQDTAHRIFVTTYGVDPRDFEDAGDVAHGSCSVSFVPPAQQFGRTYHFFAPTNYANTQLVIVRRREGTSPVNLDCAGSISGWQSIDADFEMTRVWLSRDTNDAFTPQVYPSGTCDNGPHSIQSNVPFGLTVYAWSNVPFSPFNGLALGPVPDFQLASSYQFAPVAIDEPQIP